MLGILPSKKQWDKWSLPSKLTALSLYIGIPLGLVGLLYAIFASGPQPPPEDMLRHDALENVEILGRKLMVADDLYRRMRQAEKNGDKNPYIKIADRLKRDLPSFDLTRVAALEDSKARTKEPFKTYLEVDELLKSIEESEHTSILLFHLVADNYYDIQVHVGDTTGQTSDVEGIAFFGKQLQTLEGSYLLAFPFLQTHLKRVGVQQVADPPKDLYVIKELVEQRAHGDVP